MKNKTKLKIKTRYIDVFGDKHKAEVEISTFELNDSPGLWVDISSKDESKLSFDGMIPIDKQSAKQLAKFFNDLVKELK